MLFQNGVPDPLVVRKADSSLLIIQKEKLSPKRSAEHFELFNFDPNKLSVSGWEKLGLEDKVIHTIENYVSKGGKFRYPDDLRRIYGLHKEEADRLIPYVQIENRKKNYVGNSKEDFLLNNNTRTSTSGKKYLFSNRKKADSVSFRVTDLNMADTSTLIALPGIGAKLAKRIIDFRNHAGGFHSIDQLDDIYGLEDSVIHKLKRYLKVSGEVKKILINKVSMDSLAIHPYISKSQAKSIIQFRQMHGTFDDMDKLKMIHNIDLATLEKIQPYLDFLR